MKPFLHTILIILLWCQSAIMFASDDSMISAMGFLGHEGVLDSGLLQTIADQSSDKKVVELNNGIKNTAKCLSLIGKDNKESKLENSLEHALIPTVFTLDSCTQDYVVTKQQLKIFQDIDRAIKSDDIKASAPPVYTAQDHEQMKRLTEKLYQRMRNGILRDYLKTKGRIDKPIADIDEELESLSTGLGGKIEPHEKRLLNSMLLPKPTKKEIAENRNRVYENFNNELKAVNQSFKQKEKSKREGVAIRNELRAYIEKVNRNYKAPKTVSLPSEKKIEQKNLLDLYKLPSLEAHQDVILNSAVRTKLALEPKRKKNAVKNEEFERMRKLEFHDTHYGMEQIDGDYNSINMEISALKGEEKKQAEAIFNRFKQKNIQIDNEEKKYTEQQHIADSNSLMMAAKNNGFYDADDLKKFGSEKNVSAPFFNAVIKSYFRANQNIIKELEEWHNDNDPEEFLKKSLYLDPMLSAQLIAEDPSLAPLLCKIARSLEGDQQMDEKVEQLVTTCSLAALIAVGVASGGVALVGSGALASTMFIGGSIAIGLVGFGLDVYSIKQATAENQSLEDRYIALGVGDPKEIKNTFILIHAQTAYAVANGLMTIAEAGLFYKELNVMLNATTGSALTVSSQVGNIKSAGKTLYAVSSEASQTAIKRMINPKELLAELKLLGQKKVTTENILKFKNKIYQTVQDLKTGHEIKALQKGIEADQVAIATAHSRQKQASMQLSAGAKKLQELESAHNLQLHKVRSLSYDANQLKMEIDKISKMGDANVDFFIQKRGLLKQQIDERSAMVADQVTTKFSKLSKKALADKVATRTRNDLSIQNLKSDLDKLEKTIDAAMKGKSSEHGIALLNHEKTQLTGKLDELSQSLDQANKTFSATEDQINIVGDQLVVSQRALNDAEALNLTSVASMDKKLDQIGLLFREAHEKSDELVKESLKGTRLDIIKNGFSKTMDVIDDAKSSTTKERDILN